MRAHRRFRFRRSGSPWPRTKNDRGYSRHALRQRLGVPVIDGVGAAVKLAEGLVGLGLGTSKRGDCAAPLVKTYTGLAAPYSPR